jgi:predicted amino acid-binding ACT domain protein
VKKFQHAGLARKGGNVMSILKKIVLVLFSCMIIVSFAACKKEGPAERAGKKMDETVEKAGEEMKEAAEKTSDKIEEAGEKMEESIKK